MNDQQPPHEEESARERRMANIVLVVGAVIIVGGGIWLVNALVDAREAEECFESRPAQLQSGQHRPRRPLIFAVHSPD